MPIDLNRFIATFFDEAKEHLDTIEEQAMALGSGRDDAETLNTIFRSAHSIKGGSGTFGFTQLSEATHEIETLFDNLRKGKGKADAATVRVVLDACDVFKSHLAKLKAGERGHDPAMDALVAKLKAPAAPAAPGEAAEAKPTEEKFGFFDEPAAAAEAKPAHPMRRASDRKDEKYGFFDAPDASSTEHNRRKGDASSIRVSVDKIDRIVNLVGELVIAQAMMQQSVATQAGKADERLAHSVATLDRNTRELQQAVMSIRMMPMEFVFSRFPRLVYDVSSRLGKKVHLRTQGNETELDKELIEQLVDPLTHVVRNAIDHGIESPADRVKAGKPESGSIVMRATHRGGSVIIDVTDDGRGLDRDRIIAKARELGLPVDESWTDVQAWGLIFEAGFSTAKEVTSLFPAQWDPKLGIHVT